LYQYPSHPLNANPDLTILPFSLGGFAEKLKGGGDMKDLTMMVTKLLESQNEIKHELARMREDVNALKPDNGYHPSIPTVNALGARAPPL